MENENVKEYTQKSVELYFQEYNIENPDLKMKLLPEVTELIHDRNVSIGKLQAAQDAEMQKQLEEDVESYDQMIQKVFEKFLSENA